MQENGPPAERQGTATPEGKRVRRYILALMAAKDIPSISMLADQSDVGRDTIMKWLAGRRIAPKTGEKVARELGVSYGDLLRAREGHPPRPTDEIEDLVRRVAEETVRRLLDERGPHDG